MIGAGSARDRRRRQLTLASAVVLFAAVFVARLLDSDPSETISLLYALPIALVAVELGAAWGLAAGALALALFGVWDLSSADSDYSITDYLTRAAAFLLTGGLVGALADRLRRAFADSARYWELSNDLLCTAGFDGYFKRLSPAWERTLGWTLADLRSRPFIEFVHPDDRESTAAEAERLASANGDTLNFENRYRHRDGSYRTLQWSVRSAPQEQLLYAAARDITEHEADQRRFRGVLEGAPDAIVIVDELGEIMLVNAQAERLFGYARAEMVGEAIELLVPERHREAHLRHREGYVRSPAIRPMGMGLELFARRRDGFEVPVEISLSPLESTEGTLFTAAIRDVSERRRIEADAEAARREAERANHAKSEFLSRMSHELRTPLNAIIGFGQLLELEELDARQEESVAQMLKGGRHLLELINEVLDISRIEAGTISISREPVQLGDLIAEALSLVGPLAEGAEVSLAADPAAYNGSWVLADRGRLKQVLLNLLSNAIKFNHRGGRVRVSCEVRANDRVRIGVTDDGPGIAEEQLAELFTPFERLGAERTEIEGTGLGLTLSKRLVEAMGGTIAARSTLGEGTTINVELERAEAPELKPVAPQPPAVEPGREPGERRVVLCIEDNPSNLNLIERALERTPEVKLIPALTGTLGLELASRHRPDLVLVDLHLPDIRGQEVLERIRADPAMAGTRVVVVSADATPGQIERLRGAGADEYLTKPIDVRRLIEIVSSAPARATDSADRG